MKVRDATLQSQRLVAAPQDSIGGSCSSKIRTLPLRFPLKRHERLFQVGIVPPARYYFLLECSPPLQVLVDKLAHKRINSQCGHVA